MKVFEPYPTVFPDGVSYSVSVLLISEWGLPCLSITLGITSSFGSWTWLLSRVDTTFIRSFYQTSSVVVVELSTVPRIGIFGVFRSVIVSFAKSSILVDEPFSWVPENPCDLLFLLVVFIFSVLA